MKRAAQRADAESLSFCAMGCVTFIVVSVGEMIDDKEIMFYLRYLSSQRKKVRCQRIPFCGRSTQWFSSGEEEKLGGECRAGGLR